jgi:hypothetical protein
MKPRPVATAAALALLSLEALAQAEGPLTAPTVPPAPATAQPARPARPRWVAPVTIALEVGAVAFAVASIAVLSSGPRSDQGRVNVALGLGAGTIACAAGGVIIGVVLR